ncbi:MAG: hypothetical protein ACKV2T_09095 [Kofleriaceae bacterium]
MRARPSHKIAAVWHAPPIDCTSPRGAADERLRLWLGDTLLPTLYQQAGGGPSTLVAAPKSKTCDLLFRGYFSGYLRVEDPLLPAVTSALLDRRSEDHVFVTLVGVVTECVEKTRGVRDQSGTQVGSIGTGDYSCFEKSTFRLVSYLLSRDGTLVYASSLPMWREESDRNYTPAVAATVSAELLAEYPGR